MNNFEKAVKLMSELFQAQSRDEANSSIRWPF